MREKNLCMKLIILGLNKMPCPFPTSLFACDWKPKWSYRCTTGICSFLVKSESCSQEHILPEHSRSNERVHSHALVKLWLHSQQETTGTCGTQSIARALSIWECKATDELRLYEMETYFISTVFLLYWPSDTEQDWEFEYLYSFSSLLK